MQAGNLARYHAEKMKTQQDWAGLELDHDDPSKPSHRLTNGPVPSKTIESNGRKLKKDIEKPLMAMVRQPKNIQWWWSPQKPLKIYNGLFKTIETYNGFLKNIELVNGPLKSIFC